MALYELNCLIFVICFLYIGIGAKTVLKEEENHVDAMQTEEQSHYYEKDLLSAHISKSSKILSRRKRSNFRTFRRRHCIRGQSWNNQEIVNLYNMSLRNRVMKHRRQHTFIQVTGYCENQMYLRGLFQNQRWNRFDGRCRDGPRFLFCYCSINPLVLWHIPNGFDARANEVRGPINRMVVVGINERKNAPVHFEKIAEQGDCNN